MTHPDPIESPLRSLIKGTPMHEMTDAERDKFIGVKRLIRENGRRKLLAKGKKRKVKDEVQPAQESSQAI